MAQQNLLEIVPEQLFQNYFITEIDQVQKNLHYEIERKREDLRAMVGERYRELIHAADTIEEMRNTTSRTIVHINDMISSCKNLHDTHLVGFKVDEKPQKVQSYLSNDNVHSLAVQVKLMMEMPEKIWRNIEAENYIVATQLFILVRHINAGLQLHFSGKSVKGNAKSLHRLVQQHWNSISNFNQTIIDTCKQKLQNINISTQVASSCLVSLYLLDSQTMIELLNSLVELHSNSSLQSTLHFDLSSILDGDLKTKIKEKIINSVKVVLKTVELVYSCFVDNNGGAVLYNLKELYRKDSLPLVELAHFSDKEALKFLPSVIRNYRLTSSKDLNPLVIEDVTKCVNEWSEWVKSFIEDNLKKLLDNVVKMKLLYDIRQEALNVETPSNWDDICTTLNIPQVHVWCHYFQPLITNRVKEIIKSRWDKIQESFRIQIILDLNKVSSEKAVEMEANINWFVWKDLIGETIIESRSDVSRVMNSLMEGMWLQDRGITPTLENLCRSIDTELEKLLDDLSVYVNTEYQSKQLLYVDPHPTEKHSDKYDIQIYLSDVSMKNIQSILGYIEELFDDPSLNTTEFQRKTTAIYTARITQSMTNLMPHLRLCFMQEEANRNLNVDAWNNLSTALKTSCFKNWGKWLDIAMKNVGLLVALLPQEFTLEANLEYLMMQWDVIQIEEKDDEEKLVTSTIKVPSGPSLKLQEYLLSVSRLLDEVVPHTLPTQIHAEYLDRVTAISLEHYNKVIREKETDINQKCALQLLMDVRHLTLLLIPRENKQAIDVSQAICEFLRQKIDPFDYDVFYPYIQTNLKRSVQRVQTLLGSLILHHGQVSGVVGNKPVLSGGSADKSPTVLTMAASDAGQWFPLLPVTAPVNIHKKTEKTKKKTVAASPNRSRNEIADLMTSSLPINLANARSGAASFFNSMTSDWFSGS